MSENKAISELKTYVQNMAQFFGAPSARLLAECGRGFYMNANSFVGKRAKPKMCFMNAYNLAMESDLTYCEGYVATVIPIAHAWCVDSKGFVVDPTLEISKYGPNGFYGIPFKKDFVIRTALSTGYYGIISYTNPEFLMGKIPQVEFLEDVCGA